MLVRRDAAGVRLFTRNGHDWTGRFPLIARAALSLKAASCLIDGEAVACDDKACRSSIGCGTGGTTPARSSMPLI
jgi:ATP-dependent DNA ligase